MQGGSHFSSNVVNASIRLVPNQSMRVVACRLPDAGKPGLLIDDDRHLTVLANDEARRLVEDGVPLKPHLHLQRFESFDRCVAVEQLHAAELRPLCARLRRLGGEGCVLALGATAGPALGDGGLLARCLGELLDARSSDEDVVVSALRIDCKRGCGSHGESHRACGGGSGSDALVDLLQPVVAQRHRLKLAPSQRGGCVEVLGLTECVLSDARRGAAQLRAACVTSEHACSSLLLRLSVIDKRRGAAAPNGRGDGPSRLRLHLVLLPATEQLSAGPAAVAFGALANAVHARRPPLRDAHLTLLLRGVLRRATTPPGEKAAADDEAPPPLLAIAYVGRGVRHSAHALATLKLAARLAPRARLPPSQQPQPTKGGGGVSNAAAMAATPKVKAAAALDQEQHHPQSQLQMQPQQRPQPPPPPLAPAASVVLLPVASPEPSEPPPPLPRAATAAEALAAPSLVYQQAVDQATQAAKRAAAVAAIWDAKCTQAAASAPDAAPAAEPAFDDGGAMAAIAAAELALQTTAVATTTTAAPQRAFRRSVAPAIAERVVRFEVASPTPAPMPAPLPPTPRTGDGTARSPTATASASGTKATTAAAEVEAEALSSRLVQVMAWAQAREAQLQQQLLQQQQAAEAAVGAMGAELERRSDEARAWQEVSESLAQQQRAAALYRALGSTRHRRVRTAFGDWLTAMGLIMALDPSSPLVVGTTPLLSRFN